MHTKRFYQTGILALCALFFTACIRDGVDLENCFRGIWIKLEWIDTDPLVNTERVNITIMNQNGEELDLTSNIYGREAELADGDYSITGWESVHNIDFDFVKRTLAATGTTYANASFTDPEPFSAGSTTADIVYLLDTLVIPLPMYQQTRPLIVEVEFIDKRSPIINEFPPIKTLSATLSGITLERNINDGFFSTESRDISPAIRKGDIGYNLTQAEEPREGNIWFEASHNLLGLDGQKHTLDLHVEFENGNSEDFAFDVTDELIGFHSEEIHKPWYIVVILNLDSSLSVSIEDWIAGPDSWLIGHEK